MSEAAPPQRLIHTVAESFVKALSGQGKLTNACICDFGLDSGVPFGRLNEGLLVLYHRGWTRKLFTAQELDEAICNGPKLTELIQRVPLRMGDPIVTEGKVIVKTVHDNLSIAALEAEAEGCDQPSHPGNDNVPNPERDTIEQG